MQKTFFERKGRLEELDRSFDIQFWQAQPPQARFDAMWEMVIHAYKVMGVDVRQQRLQRTVAAFRELS